MSKGGKRPAADYRWPRRLDGALAPGTTIGNGTQAEETVPIFAARLVRIRAKVSTSNATLNVYFLLADGTTRAASANPTPVALTAGTEDVMDITVFGEAQLVIELDATGVGDSDVDYVEVFCQPEV